MWQTDLKTVPVYTNTYMVILSAIPLILCNKDENLILGDVLPC